MKRKGLTGKRIAELLGVSEGAVSQYFNHKRAKEIELSKIIKEAINEAAENIIVDPMNIIPSTQDILKMMWEEGIICELHKQHCSSLPKKCEVCIK